MSTSLNNLIELYLNDLADFDEENLLLAESVLKPVKQLLTEDKNQEDILFEAYQKSSPKQKEILKDFLLYIKEA